MRIMKVHLVFLLICLLLLPNVNAQAIASRQKVELTANATCVAHGGYRYRDIMEYCCCTQDDWESLECDEYYVDISDLDILRVYESPHYCECRQACYESTPSEELQIMPDGASLDSIRLLFGDIPSDDLGIIDRIKLMFNRPINIFGYSTSIGMIIILFTLLIGITVILFWITRHFLLFIVLVILVIVVYYIISRYGGV